MEHTEIIFESYNMVAEECFNKLLDSRKAEDAFRLKEEDFAACLQPQLEAWADQPVEELKGMTPRQYFNSLSDFEEVMNVFTLGAQMCDEKLPDAFLDKLFSFGDKAVDALLTLASDKALLNRDEEFLIPNSAINVLGDWKIERAVIPLLNISFECTEEKDMILESIERALIQIGSASVEPMVKILQETDSIGYAHETLISALSTIGKTKKTETIFRCLKSSFLKMDNKVLGAVCLAEYGDGRAIPALRGYVEKNLDTIDSEAYYQIRAAVESLGGNMDDLSIEFDEEE